MVMVVIMIVVVGGGGNDWRWWWWCSAPNALCARFGVNALLPSVFNTVNSARAVHHVRFSVVVAIVAIVAIVAVAVVAALPTTRAGEGLLGAVSTTPAVALHLSHTTTALTSISKIEATLPNLDHELRRVGPLFTTPFPV